MPPQPTGDFLPAIRRARFEQLVIYEITDTELRLLERGAPESVLLTFSIFLLSVGFSFFVALLSADIPSTRIFTTFVVITTLGFGAGLLLLCLWYWYHRSRADIFTTIRRRLLEEGEQAPLLIQEVAQPSGDAVPATGADGPQA